MGLKPITVESIEAGGLLEQANLALQELAADIIKRHRLTKARELTITITLGPKVTDAGGGVERTFVDVDWAIKGKKPGFTSMTTRAFVHGDRVMYDENDPMKQDPRQGTIFEMKRQPAEAAE